MKKIITTCVATAALLTSVQANFSFGDMFKDMKEAATNFTSDAKDSITAMKDGVVETSKSGERTISNISRDMKESSVVFSSDATKTVKTVSNNANSSLRTITNEEYEEYLRLKRASQH